MGRFVIFILILSIFNSILFYGKNLGLNVILFMLPLISFIIYVLKNEKLILNKKGPLFIIPIIILSISYFIYNNYTFIILNVPIIICLYLLMFIYTIKPTYNIIEIIRDLLYLLFRPIGCIGNFYRVVKLKIDSIFKLSQENKNKIKSILIVIPIVVVVLLLLTSADMIFNDLFSNFFKIFKKISIENIIGRTITIILLFTYLGSAINYLLFEYKKEKIVEKKVQKIENFTIKLLLSILNIIYVVFDFIQINSLILHQGIRNINYAQYAREGFFQLMFISIINLIILLISKKTKYSENKKYINVMSIIMVVLTLIIILSSFIRMYMYEMAYGYTLLRLLVYAALFTEVIMLIPTIIYIFKPNIKIIKYYMIICITMYCILNMLPLNYIIANNNINRYYKTKKIDIEYLENYSSDNIQLLIDLYNKTNDNTIKEDLNYYFKDMKNITKINGFQEYNISVNHAYEKLKNR